MDPNDVKQINLMHLIFDTFINKDPDEFAKLVQELADLRGESFNKVMFEIASSLNDQIEKYRVCA